MISKCSGVRADGTRCRWSSFSGGLCVGCGARASIPEAIAEQKRRAAAGAARTNSRPTKARRSPLRSVADCLEALERALHSVETSGSDDKIARAKAITGIVAEARATLKAAELDAENRELRTLIAERLPELRAKLRLA